MSCIKQRTIHKKKKNTPNYLASDCYGSVMLGTNRKPFVSVDVYNPKTMESWPRWKSFKGYQAPAATQRRPDPVPKKCAAFKYKTGGWKNDLLSPPYDPLDCKGLKLLGNDGNLWEVHVGKGDDPEYPPTTWRLVKLKAKSKVKPKKKSKVKSKAKAKAKSKVKSKAKAKAKSKVKSKRKGRPSPSVSATLFFEGKRKRGGDGQWWQVVLTRSGIKRWHRLSK